MRYCSLIGTTHPQETSMNDRPLITRRYLLTCGCIKRNTEIFSAGTLMTCRNHDADGRITAAHIIKKLRNEK